jgi:hypothetical protein
MMVLIPDEWMALNAVAVLNALPDPGLHDPEPAGSLLYVLRLKKAVLSDIEIASGLRPSQ